jgi:hypothetical protein
MSIDNDLDCEQLIARLAGPLLPNGEPTACHHNGLAVLDIEDNETICPL